MTSVNVRSAKLAIVLPAGQLPDVDPNDPTIKIDLNGLKISARVTAKAARKLKVHAGGAVLQGKLVVDRGQLLLADAGFQWLEPKSPSSTTPDPVVEVTVPPPAADFANLRSRG